MRVTRLSTAFYLWTCASMALIMACNQGLLQKTVPIPEREEIQQSYTLSPGARVTITHLPFGSLVVQPVDTMVAELRIIRSAATDSDLKCSRISVIHTSASLNIRGDDNSDCIPPHSAITQSVLLRLPRSVSIEMNTISATLMVGEAEGRGPDFVTDAVGRKIARPLNRPYVYGKGFNGSVSLRNINGPVKLVQGTGETRISGVNGAVRVALRHPDSKSLTINGITGGVTLLWGATFNGQITTYNLRGSLLSRGTSTASPEDTKGRYRIPTGSEASMVSVSGVIGDVTVVRGDEEE